MHSTDLDQDSVWLVYKWEGLRPMNLYLEAGPPQPQGFGLFKSRCVQWAVQFIHSSVGFDPC